MKNFVKDLWRSLKSSEADNWDELDLSQKIVTVGFNTVCSLLLVLIFAYIIIISLSAIINLII